MNLIELSNLCGNHPSPVVNIVAKFQELRDIERTESEQELFLQCCHAIANGQWHGFGADAAAYLGDDDA
jgi:hypothetical protein